jgi:VanZ family protein
MAVPHMRLHIIRVSAWSAILILILLSIVPPGFRPVTPAPQELEHFASFALAGALQYLGYRGRLVSWFAVTVVFCGVIELLQLLVPGRHARFSDFVINCVAGCCGICLAFVGCRRVAAD